MATEYVTCTVSVLSGDGIVVQVLNHSTAAHNTHVRIFQNTGAGAVQAADGGVVSVAPTWEWGLGFTVKDSGEYWVQIEADSDFLIPKVSFERDTAGTWVPRVSYAPGDFAIFEKGTRRVF